MKLVAISDTHNRHAEINLPQGDILIHAGDATGEGSLEEVLDFLNWFAEQPFAWKIFCAGNHDFLWQQYDGARDLAKSRGIIYLEDETCEIEGIKFYGSPWVPDLIDWAFGLPKRSMVMKSKRDEIPYGTNVLITHAPPYGIGDKVLAGMNVGDLFLRDRVYNVKPEVHVFGHIHESYGIYRDEAIGTVFLNAAILNRDYEVHNRPHLIDLSKS